MRVPLGHGPVARFLKRALLVAGVVVLATWLMLWIDRRTLPGIKVQGAPLPRTSDPVTALKPLASQFAQSELEIRTGVDETPCNSGGAVAGCIEQRRLGPRDRRAHAVLGPAAAHDAATTTGSLHGRESTKPAGSIRQ